MTRRSDRLHFVVPGALDQATGGYRYDAAIIAGLRAQGRDIVVHELAGRFPDPDPAARAAARRACAAVGDAPAVIDGLALPAFQGLLGARSRIVGLVHHPLWLETGLAAETATHLRAVETEMLGGLERVIVTSRATARDVAALGVDFGRIRVVEPGTPRGRGRARTGRPLRLLCVAALTSRKAHDVLIAALRRRRSPPWRLLCVGGARDAGYARGLRAIVRGAHLGRRIRFAGEVPWRSLARLYANADLFVLPSLHEGYGMAFAEALAHGLPVIGARAGAVPYVVPPQAGMLASPGNSGALARVLCRVFRRGLRTRLARGAYLRRRWFPDWPEQAQLFAAALAR